MFSLLVRRAVARLVQGVASWIASLLLRFGCVWVDVEICFLFWRVVLLLASREARLGRRLSDSVVAS